MITYFIMILTLPATEMIPNKFDIILPFEEEYICKLASRDILGYDSPNQCKPHTLPPLLKMNSPHPKPLPRPKSLFKEIE